MLGTNMDDSEKLRHVIGKAAKPRCFKNIKSLPCSIYTDVWLVRLTGTKVETSGSKSHDSIYTASKQNLPNTHDGSQRVETPSSLTTTFQPSHQTRQNLQLGRGAKRDQEAMQQREMLRVHCQCRTALEPISFLDDIETTNFPLNPDGKGKKRLPLCCEKIIYRNRNKLGGHLQCEGTVRLYPPSRCCGRTNLNRDQNTLLCTRQGHCNIPLQNNLELQPTQWAFYQDTFRDQAQAIRKIMGFHPASTTQPVVTAFHHREKVPLGLSCLLPHRTHHQANPDKCQQFHWFASIKFNIFKQLKSDLFIHHTYFVLYHVLEVQMTPSFLTIPYLACPVARHRTSGAKSIISLGLGSPVLEGTYPCAGIVALHPYGVWERYGTLQITDSHNTRTIRITFPIPFTSRRSVNASKHPPKLNTLPSRLEHLSPQKSTYLNACQGLRTSAKQYSHQKKTSVCHKSAKRRAQWTAPQPNVLHHPGIPIRMVLPKYKRVLAELDFVPCRKVTRPVLYTVRAPLPRKDQCLALHFCETKPKCPKKLTGNNAPNAITQQTIIHHPLPLQ
ncbi:hypothetical protein PR048_022327 [Dryococelus australis]|uniref:Uncharacterized protein n=1 Tax=Dryococelus australis TaxID=614101 RepID=A0ABQ9H0Z3_9NEOP|nr:hypothetical protein PR048_022327 [Dryococelus australis]